MTRKYHWATGGYGKEANAVVYYDGQPVGELSIPFAGKIVDKLNTAPVEDGVDFRKILIEVARILMWRAKPEKEGDRPHDDYSFAKRAYEVASASLAGDGVAVEVINIIDSP